ncbi:MAG: TniB family NTP-binding protein [Pyrinomonadaceae bacterium]
MRKVKKAFLKMSIEERLRLVERIYVRRPKIDELLERIDYCREHSKIAKDPDCLLITGEPGTGKTSLLERYVKRFPRRVVEKKTEDGLKKSVCLVPVLYIICPTKATEKNLVEVMLTELGDPEASKGNLTTQTLRLVHYVKECEMEEILVDEFQHLWDRDGNVIRKNVANYVKEIIIRTKKPMIVAGMPSSAGIMDDNQQLNRRFRRVSLDPLKWEPSQQKGSAKPVSEYKAFLSILDDALPFKRSNLSDQVIAYSFFKASGGIVDKVMRLVRTATALAIKDGLEKLDREVLAESYEKELRDDYPEDENPFTSYPNASKKKATKADSKKDSVSKRIKPKEPKKPTANSVLRRR